jgi:DUF4097 and DUF4098 domain-containing protein YvlB
VFFSTFCNVDYTVEVPARMAVVARTSNDDIRLSGVDGSIDARTDNGRVQVRGSGTAPLRLGTDNGSVVATELRSASVVADSDNGSVELSFVRPPEQVQATTDNGEVTVVVPDDGTAYALDMGTDNGSTAASIRTDPGSSRSIVARSDNGDILVTYAQG